MVLARGSRSIFKMLQFGFWLWRARQRRQQVHKLVGLSEISRGTSLTNPRRPLLAQTPPLWLPDVVHPHHRELLELMKPLRDSACRVRASEDEWPAAHALVQAIDKLAVVLTGDAEHFFARPHSLVPARPTGSGDG